VQQRKIPLLLLRTCYQTKSLKRYTESMLCLTSPTVQLPWNRLRQDHSWGGSRESGTEEGVGVGVDVGVGVGVGVGVDACLEGEASQKGGSCYEVHVCFPHVPYLSTQHIKEGVCKGSD